MRLKYFIFGIIILLCARSVHATQTIDKRQYVDWNSYPYNQIVAFQHELPTGGYVQDCTAQYVAKDIILTARHCITKQLGHDNWAEKNKQEYTNRITQITINGNKPNEIRYIGEKQDIEGSLCQEQQLTLQGNTTYEIKYTREDLCKQSKQQI